MLLVILTLLSLSPQQARQRPLGSTVVVDGFVTVPSGAFRSFRQDEGFVLGNDITGIYVATQKKGYRSLGSAVEVRGQLADDHGLLILRATDIRLKKGRSLVRPRKITLAQVDEAHEGQLVRLEGEVARVPMNDLPSGYKLFLKGSPGGTQVFFPATVVPDLALLRPGQKIQVTGWCGQYDQTYEVVVRTAKDVKVIR